MAILYPNNPIVRSNGERELIQYLKEHLDESWSIYYEPIFGENQPDLVLFSEYYGILVVEIKDYVTSTIQSTLPNQWIINVNGMIKNVKSPYLQARDYTYNLIDRLSNENMLIQTEGNYSGNLKFPVISICFFSKLTMSDITQLKINNVIPEKHILTYDRLEMENIQDYIHNVFSNYFIISPLGEEEVNLVKSILFPSFSISQLNQYDKNEGNHTQEKNKQNDGTKTGKNLEPKIKNDVIVQSFSSLTDELLFVATEIRHLLNKKILVEDIIVAFNKNRSFSRGYTVLGEIQSILTEIGVKNSTDRSNNDIFVTSIDYLDNLTYEVIFLVDLNSVRHEDEKKSALTLLTKISTQKKVYLSFNNKTFLTQFLLQQYGG